METETVFGTAKYQIESCLSETGNGKGQTIEGISLLLSQEGRIKLENGQLVSIELTKEDAKEFAIQLLRLSSGPIPERGFQLDNYGTLAVSVHQAREESGKPSNEPILYLGDVEPDDIPEDGNMSICLTNDAARGLISELAKIV